MESEVDKQQGADLLARLIGNELPDEHGRYGPFGGCYAPETLVPALARLAENVYRYLDDDNFMAHLDSQLRGWVGRPTPLTHAAGLSERWGAAVFLKREDLAHTGAHKINNALGQALLAREMGAKRVIAETG
ncbi:MAG: pyridoxal-phosphate dependent enzyme, partial [Gammaproteobacteria bacterium]|nr:pyridoxal-phosphate dependent enzyme [Gammaproteobacteria bacterium]